MSGDSRDDPSGPALAAGPEPRVGGAGETGSSFVRWVSEALAYVLQPAHLRRTVGIALVVGLVLTLINHMDVIVAGDATARTWIKCGLSFLVPFVVANLGLLAGRDVTASRS